MATGVLPTPGRFLSSIQIILPPQTYSTREPNCVHPTAFGLWYLSPKCASRYLKDDLFHFHALDTRQLPPRLAITNHPYSTIRLAIKSLTTPHFNKADPRRQIIQLVPPHAQKYGLFAPDRTDCLSMRTRRLTTPFLITPPFDDEHYRRSGAMYEARDKQHCIWQLASLFAKKIFSNRATLNQKSKFCCVQRSACSASAEANKRRQPTQPQRRFLPTNQTK